MPRTRRQRQVHADLTERYGRAVADAFFAAIDSIRNAAEVQRLTAAIEAGQIEEALEALHLDPEAFDLMLDRIRDAYAEGGRAGAESMPKRRPDGTALVVRFDGRNPEAEAWLARHSSDLITRITEEQRQMVRDVLVDGMQRGVNPRQAALGLVGRVSRVTGRREGGVLGLSAPQERAARGARAQLASNDPDDLRAYLTRKRRDRRFDRSITKAIREGKPVPAEIAQNAATAYERRLLQQRGETIGRVEAMTSLQQAKFEAYRQAVASGKVPANAVRKVWRSASDLRVRDTHMILNGETTGLTEAFASPSGARLRFPMDTALGAGPDEIVNCRCDCEYRIDWLANSR